MIGQACEFDYSGTQALKVLREEGYRTVLINSNPATIMTDPGWADRTYLEPLDVEGVAAVLRRERPDALLPTLGGQTALNLSIELAESGVLDELGIELIGASREAIHRAEDREAFAEAMASVGLRVPRSRDRPDDGRGRGRARRRAPPAGRDPARVHARRPRRRLRPRRSTSTSRRSRAALRESPISQILLEESVEGWGEFELEVIRDRLDNVVIICSIENIDPMGVHTGDSICVAPSMTLSDREYQTLRDAAAAVIRVVGVETGGSNVQFALNRETGELVVIEMNPRVSRSSALASKATGYPIAKVATRLAIGYTLDEIPNDITGTTPASFEPTIDYVVVKAPRFAFEKFPGADGTLTTQMKSVGEAMGIGRNFCEAMGKTLRSRELDGTRAQRGRHPDPEVGPPRRAARPHARGRVAAPRSPPSPASTPGSATSSRARSRSSTTPARAGSRGFDHEGMRQLKRHGVSDTPHRDAHRLERGRRARRAGASSACGRCSRRSTRAAARSPPRRSYLYSSYDRVDEPLAPGGAARADPRLGPEPDRAGHRVRLLLRPGRARVPARAAARRSWSTATPRRCRPTTTPRTGCTSSRSRSRTCSRSSSASSRSASSRSSAARRRCGSPARSSPRASRSSAPIRRRSTSRRIASASASLLDELGLRAPEWGIANDADEAVVVAERIGYPVLVRPSYVLGGRAMRVCYGPDDVRSLPVSPNSLVDRFLEDAIEVDVDAVSDGETVLIGGVMQHVEEAGVHSGDSACVLPPLSLGPDQEAEMRRQTTAIARGLGVRGLVNVQFALHEGTVYVLEANPRASRTVPFVEKAVGIDLVGLACRVALGERLAEIGATVPTMIGVAVKEAVLPFARFPGADPVLGPEMRSTGEVMALAPDFPTAYAKASRAAGMPLPSLPNGVGGWRSSRSATATSRR